MLFQIWSLVILQVEFWFVVYVEIAHRARKPRKIDEVENQNSTEIKLKNWQRKKKQEKKYKVYKESDLTALLFIELP